LLFFVAFFSIRWGTSLRRLGGSSNSTVPGDQQIAASQTVVHCLFWGFGFGRRAK